MYKLINGECIEEMQKMETGSIDMVMCDPPFATTANKWDVIIPFDKMWAELNRVVKKDGAIALCCAQPFTSMLVCSNLKRYKHHWIWEKDGPTGFQVAKYRPMMLTEDVIVFANHTGKLPYNPQMLGRARAVVSSGKSDKTKSGTSPLTNHDYKERRYEEGYPNNVIRISRDRGGFHPTQKPVALMEYLIKSYTNPGETVLDFTMGSGSTICAARNADRKSIGIEMSPEYFEKAKDRIDGFNVQRKLF